MKGLSKLKELAILTAATIGAGLSKKGLEGQNIKVENPKRPPTKEEIEAAEAIRNVGALKFLNIQREKL